MVVMILGIVGALAAPMFSSTDSDQLKAAARLIAADLAFAQIESISHGDDLCVAVFDATDHKYHLAKASDTTIPIKNPADQKDYVVEFGKGRAGTLSGVQIHAHSFDDDDELSFGLYGQLDETLDQSITLTKNGLYLKIWVDANSGEVEINPVTSTP